MKIVLWLAQVAVAAILGMNAFVKFFNYTDEGSKALADALGVGRGTVTIIGAGVNPVKEHAAFRRSRH